MRQTSRLAIALCITALLAGGCATRAQLLNLHKEYLDFASRAGETDRQLAQKVDDLRASLEDLARLQGGLEARLGQSNEKTQRELARVREVLAGLEHSRNELDQRLEELDRSLSSVVSSVAVLQGQQDALKKQLDSLQNHREDDTEESIKQITEGLQELRGHVDKVTQQLKALSSQVVSLTKRDESRWLVRVERLKYSAGGKLKDRKRLRKVLSSLDSKKLLSAVATISAPSSSDLRFAEAELRSLLPKGVKLTVVAEYDPKRRTVDLVLRFKDFPLKREKPGQSKANKSKKKRRSLLPF